MQPNRSAERSADTSRYRQPDVERSDLEVSGFGHARELVNYAQPGKKDADKYGANQPGELVVIVGRVLRMLGCLLSLAKNQGGYDAH